MPRISEFFGIVIAMYYNDQVPPHFHAKYAEHEAQVVIESLALLHGSLPRRALAMVLELAAIHRDELRTKLGSGAGREAAVQNTGSGMTRAELIRVTDVEPLDGYRLRVRFASGEERDIDVERYLRGPVFEPIREDRALFEAVTVDEELGVVVWPNGADIDSAVLYGARQPAWSEEVAGSPGMVRERRSRDD